MTSASTRSRAWSRSRATTTRPRDLSSLDVCDHGKKKFFFIFRPHKKKDFSYSSYVDPNDPSVQLLASSAGVAAAASTGIAPAIELDASRRTLIAVLLTELNCIDRDH